MSIMAKCGVCVTPSLGPATPLHIQKTREEDIIYLARVVEIMSFVLPVIRIFLSRPILHILYDA